MSAPARRAAASRRAPWRMLRCARVGILLLLGNAANSAVSVRDDLGREARFDHPPARIVTLLPSLTETVCVVGACSRLVGTDRYSNWPQSVTEVAKLGGLEDAPIERIVSLHPDLVLAARSTRVVDRLTELGITVVTIDAKSLADVRRVLNLVALIVGTPDAGEQAWRRISAQIESAVARVPPAWRGRRAYFEVSEAPHAASTSSFIGELLAQLGLGNVVPGERGTFPQLTPEFVVRAQPDLILTAAAELQGMALRPGWDALTALRGGRSCGFTPAAFDVIVRPGPRLGEAADEIVRCLTTLPAGGSP